MPRRGYSAFGLEQTRPHLWLRVDQLDLLSKHAKETGRSFSELCEAIVAAWCVERAELDRHLDAALEANDATMQMLREIDA
jgi:hypothetical protein